MKIQFGQKIKINVKWLSDAFWIVSAVIILTSFIWHPLIFKVKQPTGPIYYDYVEPQYPLPIHEYLKE